MLPNLYLGLFETPVNRFDGLNFNHTLGMACSTSRHTDNYHGLLQIPKYAMLNSLSGKRRWNHHFLRLAILELGGPDFVKIEHQIDGAAVLFLPQTAHRFVLFRKIRRTCRRSSFWGVLRVSINSLEDGRAKRYT
jgi:hypothetical protein